MSRHDTARTLAELDDLIADASVAELPGWAAALAARVSRVTARVLEGLTEPEVRPQGDTPPDGNLGVGEASRRLGMTPGWLYRNARNLPFTRRIGRRLLFSARGLDRWNLARSGP